MISESQIMSMPVEDRKKLVDYMEGLPSATKNLIKMLLQKPYMDRAFFNDNRRRLHDFSTLDKYLPKYVEVERVSNPDAVDYQKEYFSCMTTIMDNRNPKYSDSRYTLSTILNMDCYNIETLIKLEVSIGEFLHNQIKSKLSIDRVDCEAASIINNIIMPYKFKAYDFYTYLDINSEIQLRENDYSHTLRICNMIRKLMRTKSSMTAFSDIGILIYIYYKDLGMEDHIQKYHLFDRFELTMYYLGIPDEYIKEAEEKLAECVNSKMSITAAASNLINSFILSNVDNIEPVEIPVTFSSPNIDEHNGFIFTFKDIKKMDPELLDSLSLWLRSLTKDEILHYVDFKPEYLTFTLNDNDIGHIRTENKIHLGTAYNAAAKSIRYLIEKDGIFYLLFKNRMNTRIVYGLSVEYDSIADKSRKMITVKESASVYFNYIPEM